MGMGIGTSASGSEPLALSGVEEYCPIAMQPDDCIPTAPRAPSLPRAPPRRAHLAARRSRSALAQQCAVRSHACTPPSQGGRASRPRERLRTSSRPGMVPTRKGVRCGRGGEFRIRACGHLFLVPRQRRCERVRMRRDCRQPMPRLHRALKWLASVASRLCHQA